MASDFNKDPLWSMYSRMVAKRRQWEGHWQELARFEFPMRELSLGTRSEGEAQSTDITDSTVIFSNQVLAASLQVGLTNQATKWFSWKSPDALLNENDEVKLSLELATLAGLSQFASSNFGTESSAFYLDLGIFGTAAMFAGEKPDSEPIVAGDSFRGALFETLPIGSYVIEENRFGKVNIIFYRRLMTAAAAADHWGADKLSEEARKMANDGDPRNISFIRAVGPKNRIPEAKTPLPIASIWFEEKTKHRVAFGGFHEFPYVIARWSKSAGEPWGWGPGTVALNDVKTLNKLVELELKAMAIAIQPPVKSTINSVIGALDLTPGGLTVVRNIRDLEELVTRSNFPAGNIKAEELRQSIRREFFVDQLIQLLSRETPQMTATEVNAKMQLIREIVGPAFIRLEEEFLRPVTDRVFNMMIRSGAMPLFPEVLEGADIKVDFESPIALAKRGAELVAMDRVTLKAQELAGLGFADVLDNINPDATLDIVREIAGAPQKMFFTDEERTAKREQRQQAEQQQQLIDQIQQGSEAAKNIAPLAKVAQETERGNV